MSDNVSMEPLQNEVAETVGLSKAFKIIPSDSSGNLLIQESLSWEIRYDPDTMIDGNIVYIGYAKAGTATATLAWLIHKFTYQVVAGMNIVSRRQIQTNIAWDSRTLGW